jgi:hypothetical protein
MKLGFTTIIGLGKPGRPLALTAGKALTASTMVLAVFGASMQGPAPLAHAVPSPDVEYTYNAAVRRHYDFPNGDAIAYGYGICDKVRSGESYPQVMDAVQGDVVPNDEASANYLVSYAVGILCPEQIWRLRNSAAGYQPPPA